MIITLNPSKKQRRNLQTNRLLRKSRVIGYPIPREHHPKQSDHKIIWGYLAALLNVALGIYLIADYVLNKTIPFIN